MPEYEIVLKVDGIIWNGNNFGDVVRYFNKTYPTPQGHTNWYTTSRYGYVWSFTTLDGLPSTGYNECLTTVHSYASKYYPSDALFLTQVDVITTIDLVIPKNSIITLNSDKRFLVFTDYKIV
jgi:hypothetical protein